jgi:[ribosomal protein S18]-alanine N-acetyltransferase
VIPEPARSASVAIRRMRAEDIDQVIALAAELKDAPQWPRSAYVAALEPTSTPRRLGLVAVDASAGEIVGFTVASLLPPQAELEVVAVGEGAQRRGIGSKLLAWVGAELKAAGVAEFMLEVRTSNCAGLGLYRSLGWRETGVRPRYYADPEEDAVQMCLELG